MSLSRFARTSLQGRSAIGLQWKVKRGAEGPDGEAVRGGANWSRERRKTDHTRVTLFSLLHSLDGPGRISHRQTCNAPTALSPRFRRAVYSFASRVPKHVFTVWQSPHRAYEEKPSLHQGHLLRGLRERLILRRGTHQIPSP